MDLAAAKSLQSCPTLCDPIDGSPPGSPIPGILQARTLEWVAISFSNAWEWKVKVKLLSRVWPSAIPWTAAYQAPSSMGFSRQEYWSGGAIAFSEGIGIWRSSRNEPLRPAMSQISSLWMGPPWPRACLHQAPPVSGGPAQKNTCVCSQ